MDNAVLRSNHILSTPKGGVLPAARSLLWKMSEFLNRSEIVVDTLHGKMAFSTKDESIGRSLFIYREYRIQTIRNAVKKLKLHGYPVGDVNGTVVDAGAGLGTVSITLMRENAFGKSIAFEPDPVNYSYLKRNIELNEFENRIFPFQNGLSDVDGELELEQNPNLFSEHRFLAPSYTKTSMSGGASVAVAPKGNANVHRLDSMLEPLRIAQDDIRLIWLDVQGHEWYSLLGASALLSRDIPVVMQLWPHGLQRAGTTDEQVLSLLGGHFSHYIDLQDRILSLQPISKLPSLYNSLQRYRATDILLLKNPE